MEETKTFPKWVLITSGFFAIMELIMSIELCIDPESVLDAVDLNATGVMYVVYMWAARQFALGVILAVATFKRSAPMLTIAYIFLLVMFAGDFLIGLLQKETALIVSAIIMCIGSSGMLFIINKRKQ